MKSRLTGIERLIVIDSFYSRGIEDKLVFIERDGHISKCVDKDTICRLTALFYDTPNEFMDAIERRINRCI